jgi:hypothetical protein
MSMVWASYFEDAETGLARRYRGRNGTDIISRVEMQQCELTLYSKDRLASEITQTTGFLQTQQGRPLLRTPLTFSH